MDGGCGRAGSSLAVVLFGGLGGAAVQDTLVVAEGQLGCRGDVFAATDLAIVDGLGGQSALGVGWPL